MFPWTTCHHFVVRLYAQKTVEYLWEVGREREEMGERGESEESIGLIDGCISFLKSHRLALHPKPHPHPPSLSVSDAAKFSHKVEQNVFFSHLKPLSDMSVEVCVF